MIQNGPIFVYNGEGAWDLGVTATIEMLETAFDTRSIRPIKSFDRLEKNTKIVVVPGGNAPTYGFELDEKGQKVMSNFVEQGGSYLGICAGAILATQSLIMKPVGTWKGSEEKVIDLLKRGKLFTKEMKLNEEGFHCLPFYPGKCVAPHVIKNWEEHSGHPDNFCAVEVVSRTESVFKACHYSGPAFLSTSAESKPLLWYKDSLELRNVELNRGILHLNDRTIREEKPVAVLSVKIGKGTAVLSGIHPEFNPETFPKNSGFVFPDEVKACEEERKNLVDIIIKELSN